MTKIFAERSAEKRSEGEALIRKQALNPSHTLKASSDDFLAKDTLFSASTSVRSVKYIQVRFGATTASITRPTANIC